MKKKILLMLTFLLLAALAVPACGGTAQEEGTKLKFAYVNPTDASDSFMSTVQKGWDAAVKLLGVDATTQFAQGDPAKMIDLTDAAIASGVDGLFLFNLDPEGLHPSIQQARDKGIEVVVMSTRDPVFGPEEVPFVGFDLEDQGYTLGRYQAKQLEDAGLVSDVDIAIFAAFAAPYSVARSGGFLKALDDAGIEYNASDIIETGGDLAECLDKTKSYILSYPETDLVLGCDSIAASGPVMAMQQLGLQPGEMMWAGFDLAPDTAAGIRAGYGASNVDEAYSYGFLGALALYMRAELGLVVGDLSVATVIVDSTNIDQFAD